MGARFVGAGSVWLVDPGPGAGGRWWSLVRGAARALTTRSYAALLIVALALVWAAPAAASDVYVALEPGDVAQYNVGAGGELTPKSPATVPVDPFEGASPNAVAVSPDGHSVYVTARGPNEVAEYDVGTDGALMPKCSPSQLPSNCPILAPTDGAPFDVAVNPDGHSVYVTNGSDTISQYDVGAGGVLFPKSPPTVATDRFPAGMAVSPDGRNVYVAITGGAVAQYNVSAGGALSPRSPATVATGPNAVDVALSPQGNNAYVINQASNTLYSDSVSQYSRLGGALSPIYPPVAFFSGHTVYVILSTGANDPGFVEQFDVGAGGGLALKAPPAVPTGLFPFDVAVSPDGRSVYVTNFNGKNISQYDVGAGGTLTPKSPATVPTPPGTTFPHGIAVRAAPSPAVPPAGGGGTTGGAGTTSGAGTGAPTAPAATPPALSEVSGVSVNPGRFRVGGAATAVAAAKKVRGPVGTTFGFSLSEDGRVSLLIQRALNGRTSRGSCVRKTPKNRNATPCIRYKAAGPALTRSGVKGPNSVPFSGRIGRRKLAPGKYRVGISSTNAAGTGTPQYASFTVLPPGNAKGLKK
jgi:DNA-binding beta-propeller fold protein YncE